MHNDLDHVRIVAGRDSLAVATTARPDGTVHASVVNAGVLPTPSPGNRASDSSHAAILGSSPISARAAGRQSSSAMVSTGWQWRKWRVSSGRRPADDLGPRQLAELLRGIFVAAGGTHEDWDEFDRVMEEEERTAVLVGTDRIRGNG